MNYSHVNISDFFLKHHQLPLPVFCFKNGRYRTRPSSDNLQIATPNSNVLQKSTRSSVHQSCFMLLYVLFISFLVRHKDNFQISNLMGAIASAIYWHLPWFGNFCTVNVTDKVLATCKPKFQNKATNFSYGNEPQELVFARVLYLSFGVSNRIFSTAILKSL